MRERGDDVLLLAYHYLGRYAREFRKDISSIDKEATRLLRGYEFPGNVRELQNYVERAVVMAESDEMTQELLPADVLGEKPARGPRSEGSDLDTLTQDVVHHGLTSDDNNEDGLYNKIVNRVERELIYQVMQSCNNVQTKAASRLGINRNTLHKKLKEYDFEK